MFSKTPSSTLAFVALCAACAPAKAQDAGPTPTFAALVDWLAARPRGVTVRAFGRMSVPGDSSEFAMTGHLVWSLERENGVIALDQRDFGGWSGTIAPAMAARLWLLPELDPVFGSAGSVVAIEAPGEIAARVRRGIAGARGTPLGSDALFDSLLTPEGMRLTASDFFGPLVAWRTRPESGAIVELPPAPRTATPFGILDVATRHWLEAREVPCSTSDPEGSCLELSMHAEPNPEELAAATMAHPSAPPPRWFRPTRMEIENYERIVVRPSPVAVVRLESFRRTRTMIRLDGEDRDRELAVTESTYVAEFDPEVLPPPSRPRSGPSQVPPPR